MHCNIQSITEYAVAPHVGAWIETFWASSINLLFWSHPMWVRGLKQKYEANGKAQSKSHPMWVRQGSSDKKRLDNKFQSTHPHGVRPQTDVAVGVEHVFQSTHPHGVRPLPHHG